MPNLESFVAVAFCMVIAACIYAKAFHPRLWSPITKVTPRVLHQLDCRADAINNNCFYLPAPLSLCVEQAKDFIHRAGMLLEIGMSADAALYANLASAALFWVEKFQKESLSESADAVDLTKQLSKGLDLIKQDRFETAQLFFQDIKGEDAYSDFKRVAARARTLTEEQERIRTAMGAL